MLLELKKELASNTVTGVFNTPVTSMGRTTRQNVNKETIQLVYMADQMDLIDSHRTAHPTAAEYAFFCSEHGTLSRIDYMLGHKTRHNKLENIEMCHGYFQNKMQLS